MNREDEIFAEAIELPATERAAFLDRACAGDAGLRTRVAALIEGHEAASDFLEKPLIVRPPAAPGEAPGDVLGNYTLIRKVGEGGCGVVYLAEQHHPVRRMVALKVIKLGMDTREVIARFEAERQALALMDHPDIARVFDAGSTAEGRPFFVMEFVDGVPITKFCDEHSLNMEARLELFARVCLALQHAHQKGVIHRDLKPSNVLVASQDGVPTPKVIDFGIAKATQGRLTDQTLFTSLDQLIGTPAYMSPEQAELRELDIDTRSDVYSLGVLLYELLTGRPPYDPKSLVRAGVDEIRRIIREVDPPRPSTCIATLTEADRDTVARLRQAAPVRLRSALRGDLDWIVMRCLEKDRERRYSTAYELADDVRRHLRDEPVVARPPSTGYRVRKFVARNRVACIGAAAVALALIVGTIVSVRQAIRATRAEQVAKAETVAAEKATRAEAIARGDAQRRQEQAEALMTYMLGDFRTELKKANRLNLLDNVGAKAMEYFTQLDSRDLTDNILNQQARALTQIGETRIDQLRYADAAASFASAYQRTAELVKRHPQDGDMLFERAQAEYWIGFVARLRGNMALTVEWFTKYRDSAAALVALEGQKYRAQRELTSSLHNLAVLDVDRGSYETARKGFLEELASIERMIPMAPNDLGLRQRVPEVLSWLGVVSEREGKLAEALENYTDMSGRIQAFVTLEPTVPRWRIRFAESLISIATIQSITARPTEAMQGLTQAIAIYEGLSAEDPTNAKLRHPGRAARLQLAALILARGDLETAGKIVETARQEYEEFVKAEPTSRTFVARLVEASHLEASYRLAAGRADAAEAAMRAVNLETKLLQDTRIDERNLGDYARSCLVAGRIAAKNSQPAEAARLWARGLAAIEATASNSTNWRLLDPAAQLYLLSGKTAEARPLIERLKRFGYRPIDPLAASLLDAASQ